MYFEFSFLFLQLEMLQGKVDAAETAADRAAPLKLLLLKQEELEGLDDDLETMLRKVDIANSLCDNLRKIAYQGEFIWQVGVSNAGKSSSVKAKMLSRKTPSTEELLAWPTISCKSSLQCDLLHSTNLFIVANFLSPKEYQAFIWCVEAWGLEHQGRGGPLRRNTLEHS